MADEKKPRLKRLKRADKGHVQKLLLTERDTDLIRSVYAHQVLTTTQIRLLIFDGKPRSTQCDLRLKLLFHHGYLERRSQATLYKDNKPLVYFLTEKGARHLATSDGVDRSEIYWRAKFNQISPYHIQHLLQVNDVRIAIEQSCADRQYDLIWLDEFTIRRLKLYDKFQVRSTAGAIYTTTLIPDGFFTIDTPDLWLSCFLEVDRGTESLKVVTLKLSKYLAYFATNAYRERYGTQDEHGHEVYPCVLTITTSQKRVIHLRSVAREVGASDIFLFTTFADLTSESVFAQPIWQTATRDTPMCLIY